LQQNDLPQKFTNDIRNLFDIILRNPEIYPTVKKRYRQAKLSVFPFVVVYSIDKKEKLIYISSIFHTSRNPTKKFRK